MHLARTSSPRRRAAFALIVIALAVAALIAAMYVRSPETPSSKERRELGARAQQARELLLASGASTAHVKVSVVRGSQGRERAVLAQVFLPDDVEPTWSDEQAARLIASTAGTSTSRVTILDERRLTRFDGAAEARANKTLAK